MRILVILLAAAALTGCAAKVVSSNPRAVVVHSEAMDAGEAQKLADAECAKNKRFARMSGKPTFHDRDYTFDCVE